MNEAYSCPTCRRPLVMGNHEQSMNDQARQVADDEQLARRLSSGVDQSASGHDLIGGGTVPNQPQGPGNSIWRLVTITLLKPGLPPRICGAKTLLFPFCC